MVYTKGKSSTDPARPRRNEDVDKRRLRNRLAQRAFRQRQAGRMKELLDRADSSDKPYDEVIRSLQEENSTLRRNLIEVQAKLARLVVTMQTLSGAVSKALDDSDFGESSLDSKKLIDDYGSSSCRTDQPTSREPDTSSFLNIESINDAFQDTLSHREASQMAVISTPLSEKGVGANIEASFNSLAQQIPSIWSFEYQMGLDPFTAAIASSEESSLALGKTWTESNSPFSDHIHVLQRLMKSKIEHKMKLPGQNSNCFFQEVLMVLALFNSLTRPDVMRWYAKTRFYHIVNLTTWQIMPCTRTFNAIHPQYKPTTLQLQSVYPKVIDWIPFPSIRDRLIQLHSANPNIDQIFCDTVSSYVVETWMSDLIEGAPMIKAYVRVTDLVPNIDSSTTNSADIFSLGVNLPAPDVATLFSSSEYCRAVFNHLKMDHDVSNYKLDPAFFARYPELYDHDAEISAEGLPLRPEIQIQLTRPKRLESQTFQTYRYFIDFAYDWPFCVPGIAG